MWKSNSLCRIWRHVDVCSRKYQRTDTCTFEVTVNERDPLIPRVSGITKCVGIGDGGLVAEM
jgi:hypothetical protein